jgi:drug/metabolite transporter (DMT)-like permease
MSAAVPRLAPSPQAFATLLLVAVMFSGNHVAARFAFDQGLDVATAVAVRSLVTALVVGVLVRLAGVPLRLAPRQRRAMAAIGMLVALQSLALYGAVARLPVALALLVFNTFPLWTALAAWVFYRDRPAPRVLWAMPVILLGLALALDVSGAAAGLAAGAHWSRIGGGVALAALAAAAFGGVLALTQHEVATLDGRLRTALTMALVGALALVASLALDGPQWPRAAVGWWGLAALTLLYGTAITIVFTLLPKLGVVGNSPLLNVEPVAALGLAWALLGQVVAPVQIVGALVVVGTVTTLGLRRPAPAR